MQKLSKKINQPMRLSMLLPLVLGFACDQGMGPNTEEDAELIAESEDSGEIDDLVDEEPTVARGSLPAAGNDLTVEGGPIALTGTHKICSVIAGGAWRDTIVVPQAWTASTCNSFRSSVGAPSYQLGCITDGGTIWGAGGGFTPLPNTCGW